LLAIVQIAGTANCDCAWSIVRPLW